MRFYDIAQEIRAAQELLEEWAIEHDGDVTDFPLADNLAGVEMDRETKLLSIACVVKDYEADADAIAGEIKSLTERKKSATAKADRMRAYIEVNIKPSEKLSDSRAAISWRSSKSVDVLIEPEQLPEQYQRVTVAADKAALKDALGRGEIIVGCSLVSRQNMQIK